MSDDNLRLCDTAVSIINNRQIGNMTGLPDFLSVNLSVDLPRGSFRSSANRPVAIPSLS